jgi:ATP-dependent helicase HrpB
VPDCGTLPAVSGLPIDPLREPLLAAVERSNAVVSAPTGSGKSTQLPRWLATRGRVLVVEPRRVACRALASRVADLEGSKLGGRVGYIVRDDRRASSDTRILFATPGVVLRMLRSGLDAQTLVLDEFHERGLDTDLILALALHGKQRVVLTSATLDGDRLSDHIDGPHLRGEGRLHPVDIEHLPGGPLLPTVEGVERRVRGALDRLNADGHVLVFLPGVGEIRAVKAALHGRSEDIVPLHGRLSLDEQSRALRAGNRRRIYLATNVAETSLTLPGVVAVIDSGLVRRTSYHGGRGYLALGPVAMDSAEQRAGRAGRLGPGRCVRLWSPQARLEARTPPAIHRDSLVPLVLAAAACGAPSLDLPWYDAPKPHALDAARSDLQALGAVDDDGVLLERGERLFAMPTDPWLGRLLAEFDSRGLGEHGVALAASLSTRRRLFAGPPDEEEDLRAGGCDAVAGMRAVWSGTARHGLDRHALEEARASARRFRTLLGLPRFDAEPRIDRKEVAMALLAAWPRSAHIARRRKRRIAWANGEGPELGLGRESAVQEDDVAAVVVLEQRAMGVGGDRRLLATRAMPVKLTWLVEAGLGRPRVAGVERRRGRIVAKTERVYAGKVLSVEEEVPKGQLLRDAVQVLILRGSLFKGLRDELPRRLERLALARGLDGGEKPAPMEEWLKQRLEDVGLERANELSLLEVDDLLPAPLDPAAAAALDDAFPPSLSIGDATYAISYEVARRVATFKQVGGTRKTPPPDRLLPRLRGWKLMLERKNKVTELRARR